MTVYHLVYDIQQAGCRYWFVPFYCLAVLAFAWFSPLKADASNRAMGILLGGFLALLTAILTWGDYWTLVRSVKSGKIRTVEGVVHDFRAAPDSKAEESFAVGNQTFSYKTYALKQGFNTLTMNGGPIVEGARIRVTYVGDQIVRLETKLER